MPENTIEGVPEFTQVEGTEQVVEPTQAVVEETPEPETETPAEPAAAETPSEPAQAEVTADTGTKTEAELRYERQIQGLLNEIKTLRGKNRQLTPQEQQALITTQQKVDELQDVNPDDVKVIDKILRAKGYLTKDEAAQMTYKAIEQDEVNKFLEKYPEYKPENDPHDLNWSALQRELTLYARPNDARKWSEILDRAHKVIVKPSSDRGIPEKKQQLKTASIGSGGTQRSSSHKSLDPSRRSRLEQGGWSEEEIQRIEKNLTE